MSAHSYEADRLVQLNSRQAFPALLATDCTTQYCPPLATPSYRTLSQVPVLSGSGLVNTAEDAVAAAEAIGYPVLLKATGGGGGRGIFLCYSNEEVLSQFHVSQKQGEQFFGNSGVSNAQQLAAGCTLAGSHYIPCVLLLCWTLLGCHLSQIFVATL